MTHKSNLISLSLIPYEMRKQFLFILHSQKEINVGANIGETADKCALFAVEQMIDIWQIFDGPMGSTYSNPGKYFWMQVRSELRKCISA